MTFINLSNHPVSTWSKEQLDAAVGLGFGAPEELAGGMPKVDPELDEQGIDNLADKIVKAAMVQQPGAAFVATDFTLAFLIVNKLKRNGVRCFCTTTKRTVAQSTEKTGKIIKKSQFLFVRWREYA